MIIASHQPNFFPYLGFFYNMSRCDKFIYSDDVKFAKKNFQNYTNIKTTTGNLLRLTVPIKNHEVPYKEVLISKETNWNEKMLMTIRQNYSKSEYFDVIYPKVESVLSKEYKYLIDLNLESIEMIRNCLDVRTGTYMASSLNCEGHKDERILNLCNSLNGDVYLSGLGAKVYHKDENFQNVKLVYTDYVPLKYNQKGDFIENLSSLDYLFNCGCNFPKEWNKE